MLRACGVERSGSRREAPESAASSRGGWDVARDEHALPTSSPSSAANHRAHDVNVAFMLPVTYEECLELCGSAPEPRYKCCGKRCLHALESDEPGWTEDKKTKLRSTLDAHNRRRRTRVLLRVQNRDRVQKGKKGRPAYPAAYEAIFDDVEAMLTARGACQGARFVLFFARLLLFALQTRS